MLNKARKASYSVKWLRDFLSCFKDLARCRFPSHIELNSIRGIFFHNSFPSIAGWVCVCTVAILYLPIARAALIFNYGNLISESHSCSTTKKKSYLLRLSRWYFINFSLLDRRQQITRRKQVSLQASFWRINNFKYYSLWLLLFASFWPSEYLDLSSKQKKITLRL